MMLPFPQGLQLQILYITDYVCRCVFFSQRRDQHLFESTGGHFNPMWQLAIRLQDRGHEVTMFTFDSILDGVARNEAANIQLVSLGPGPSKQQVRDFAAEHSKLGAESPIELVRQLCIVFEFVHSNTSSVILPQIMSQDREYDMVISDFFVASGLDVAHVLGIPHVIFSPTNGLMPMMPQLFRTSFFPYDSLPWNSRKPLMMNLKRSLFYTLANEVSRIVLSRLIIDTHDKVAKRLGIYENGTSFWEAHMNRPPPLVLVTSVPGLAPLMTQPPHIKWIGPSIPTKQTLPQELSQWLDQGPVIYVAMGTSVILDERQQRELFLAAKRIVQSGKYRVLWALRDSLDSDLVEQEGGIPQGLWIERFVPQNAVLSHDNVKIFISHCGFNSMIESLYWNNPIVCIPFYGDQPVNAMRVEELGVGTYLDNKVFIAKDVEEAIRKVEGDVNIAREVDFISRVIRSSQFADYSIQEIEAILHVGSTRHLRMPDTYEQAPMLVPLVFGATFIIVPLLLFIVLKSIVMHRWTKAESKSLKVKIN